MKYFVNETERKASHSTCYFEFQKGHYHDECWLQDSISIRDDLWDELHLTELINGTIRTFDYYGITVVEKSQWDEIVEHSRTDVSWKDAISDVISWVDECFEEYDAFTILGI